MDTENLRSFLEVAVHGSFTAAAGRLNLAQSTVSTRIRLLEEQLGRRLFSRGNGGVALTAAGRQLLPHAAAITRTWEQARQDIAVPQGYEHLLRLTAPAYLWDSIVMPWIAAMRERQPKVALRLEGSFPDSALDQVADGLLDLCILHLPRPIPGVAFEALAVDRIVLVRHAAQNGSWSGNYIFVDWGPDFRVEHERAFGAMAPAISTGLVSGALEYVLTQRAAAYLPYSAVEHHLERGELQDIAEAPSFRRPIYVAYPDRSLSSEVVEAALDELRSTVGTWPEG